jgi:hypothetical protein
MGIQGQLRRAPTLALRAVFAGIGRVVISAERQPGSPGSPADRAAANGGQPRQPAGRRQRPSVAPVAPPGSRWRSLDKTGNVRLLSDEDVDDDYDVLPEPAISSTVNASAAAELEDGPDPAASPRQALPLPGYDELSLASIRARLRGLDVSQLRVLAEYESKNAERPEVLGMFERRIEKLEAGG